MKTKIFDADLNSIDYFTNAIDNAVSDFCEEYNIPDLKTETQNVFNGCLRYVYKRVFKPHGKYSVDNRYNSVLNYNDIDLFYGVLYHYIYLCDIYGKAVNVMSFSAMTGIHKSVIYDWYNGLVRESNPKYADVFKILDSERERSLSDLLVSGKRQPIGVLAVLNHEKGWNLPGSTREVKHVASVEDASTIQERYKARISDSSGNSSGDDIPG